MGRGDIVMRWTGRALELSVGPAPGGQLLVADSWIVDEGRQRAARGHWARFATSCTMAGIDRDELRRFEVAARAAMPREGHWFPRVELTTEGLTLRMRRAQPPVPTARVVVGPPGDPRSAPRRKGPDLKLLSGLRAQARALGADEHLLCAADGTLLEGALSSLLWWEDEALCSTPDDDTLPGITRGLLLAIARAGGVEVRRRAALPAELAGREVWLTSALHGIRVVTTWLDPEQDAGEGVRAPAWRHELARRSVPT